MIPPLIMIVGISLLASLVVTVVYKFATNQQEMKRLREEADYYQKEIKKIKDPGKAIELQKKAMHATTEYSMHSIKPTFITLIPLLLIFSWLNLNLAYEPLRPNAEFTATISFASGVSGPVALTSIPELKIRESAVDIREDKATFTISGPEGDYTLNFVFDNLSVSRDLIISNNRYSPPILNVKDSDVKATGLVAAELKSPVKKITLSNEPMRPLGTIEISGYRPGWLAVYIISSLIFSLLFKKLFKLY